MKIEVFDGDGDFWKVFSFAKRASIFVRKTDFDRVRFIPILHIFWDIEEEGEFDVFKAPVIFYDYEDSTEGVVGAVVSLTGGEYCMVKLSLLRCKLVFADRVENKIVVVDPNQLTIDDVFKLFEGYRVRLRTLTSYFSDCERRPHFKVDLVRLEFKPNEKSACLTMKTFKPVKDFRDIPTTYGENEPTLIFTGETKIPFGTPILIFAIYTSKNYYPVGVSLHNIVKENGIDALNALYGVFSL